MMEDIMPLDGNAAAGPLADLFAVEMTRAIWRARAAGMRGHSRRSGFSAALRDWYSGARIATR
jgi:hypothetical protein